MNRKDFIKLAAMSVGGFYFANSTFSFAQPLRKLTYNKIDIQHYPIIIVGSGYGGAVAALRLCEAGKKVVLLEMGLDWGKAKIPFSSMKKPGKSAAWLRTKTIAPFLNIFPLKPLTGALDRLDYENIKIWVGRGVGGGSLVNGGMAVLPKKEYFEEMLPNLDADLFYEKYFPLVQKELKVNVADEDFLNECDFYKFNRVGEEEAHKAGFKTIRVPNVYDFDYMKKEYANEVPRSALAGEVIYGNNYGKNSLDKTYLKKALETGNLEILDLHQVVDISKREDEMYSLNINQINTSGELVETKVFTCKKLIMAAGTMGTLEILLRSQSKNNLQLTDNVGQNWGNNGNFMTGRNWVKAFSGGVGFQHSTIPVGGVDNWDDPQHTFFTEIAPLPMGLNVATTLYLMINRVDKKGSVYYDSNLNAIKLNWNENNTAKMRDNAKYFVRKMNKANGGTRSHMLFNNGFGADVCYHPLGGIVLGQATNQFGKLNNHQNLFVIDGSLIPGSIGVNPFLTITAIAEYCIENLIKENELEV
ncbi:GMC family oxidoreductase N-terminal domain-containing protein [Empedobacter sedimenti]|uniref:GMC family oxidoreductase N-terminal domain-containing protein n=1 Tax=Empedobacter sedimenti TaxID=3042610 RepID=UPI0024A6B98C|nr:GMC family oxidoreductase N-terminal domain-containing protein [Empedobacter sedimenti]